MMQLEGGAQRHFGLAHAHIAAEQTIHGVTLFHVLLDLGGGVQLVVRFVVVKAGLKVPLPVAVRREGIACGLTAAGVKLNQLLRHLLGGLFFTLARVRCHSVPPSFASFTFSSSPGAV